MSEPIRVLLVDDEELFVKSLCHVLARRGMQVRSACDGLAALLLLSEDKSAYDVIVLDLRMPGINGLDTLKRIRESDPGLPVILLTGNADVKLVSEALKEGINEVLLKPCPIDALVCAIENVHEWKTMTKQVP